MTTRYGLSGTLLAVLVAALAPAGAQQPNGPLPLKYAGPPTTAAITPGDLMTRVYLFADDSMMGRRVGTEWNDRATAYLEREVRRLGLQPAGENGTYFQKPPIYNRIFDSTSTLAVDGQRFAPMVDFVANAAGRPRAVPPTPVIFAGANYDTLGVLPASAVAGRVLVLRAAPVPSNPGQYVQTDGYRRYVEMLDAAAGVVFVQGDQLPGATVRAVTNPGSIRLISAEETPVLLYVTTRVARAMLGASLDSVAKGAEGRRIEAAIRFVDTPKAGRNVVAVLPGADPRLRHQYVALGAHNDHVGWAPRPADHDSVRAFMQVVRPQGADSPPRAATAEEAARVRAIVDSVRQLRPPRLDSIYNGADDDASGSMTVLEIAEALAKGPERPRRSVLFVWHTGEEAGLWGAEYFTAHPTVPRDSIVAQLNLDMVGRGGANDVTGEAKDGGLLRGGPGYLQLVGSRRLSTELGNLVEAVNVEQKLGFAFDYSIDANGHPQNIYCRSDHYEYAKYGIPVTFFTTGGHADYHQVTDEPQYLDYDRMANVGRLVYWTALKVANLDHRLTVDRPKPDPKGACVQ